MIAQLQGNLYKYIYIAEYIKQFYQYSNRRSAETRPTDLRMSSTLLLMVSNEISVNSGNLSIYQDFTQFLDLPGMENGIKPKNKRQRTRSKEPVKLPLTNGISINTENRKLVLHFDVRNTVLVADSVTNDNVEEALNSYFTGVTWGEDTPKGWQWLSDQPSLKPPVTGSITYYKHLEKQLVRTPEDRVALRRATGDFTHQPFGKRFNKYFQKHLRLLRWPHSKGDPKLTMTGHDGKLYHYILPAFFRLLDFLHETARDFAVIIRTYGMDAPNVLAATEYTLKGHHPSHTKPVPLPVHLQPGRVTRSNKGMTFELASGQKCSNESDIMAMLNSLTGVWGFVDDFTYWQRHDYHHTSGKPVWLDHAHPNVHHIFFDDNLRTMDIDSIVDLRVVEKGRGKSLDSEEMSKFDNVLLVQADLLESTQNPDYFIDKVQLCESNYTKYLENVQVKR